MRRLCFVGWVLLEASSILAATPSLSDAGFATNRIQFRLSGEAGQAYLVQASRDLTNWSSVLATVLDTNAAVFSFSATNTSEYFRAKVATPIFRHAVFAQVLDPRSYALVSDSFDSADPLFSTAGQYDPAKRRDGGDVAISRALATRANLHVAGKLWTRPEVDVSLGPTASVGSLAWVGSGQTGIEPGYWSTNLQENLAQINPNIGGITPPRGVVEGEAYDFVLANGNYRISQLNLSTGKILVVGKCTLVVNDRVLLSSNSVVRFNSPDSSLHLHILASDVQFRPQLQGVVNANQFMLIGQPTCVSIEVSVPNFTGVIYAPNALCELNTTSLVGACVSRALILNRPVSFHFDENLKRDGYY